MAGWMEGKAGIMIAYSNQKLVLNIFTLPAWIETFYEGNFYLKNSRVLKPNRRIPLGMRFALLLN
jgi:hypothetical protein